MCVYVSVLPNEVLEVHTPNFVKGCILIILQRGLKVKVIGQRATSPKITMFLEVLAGDLCRIILPSHNYVTA